MSWFSSLMDNPVTGGVAGLGLPEFFNPYMQIENRNYQRSLQGRMFGREDTSVQRRAADLKAAGLSPVLAAGQGAAAGPVVGSEAPQVKGGGGRDIVGAVLGMMSQKAGIESTMASKLLTEMQARKVQSEKIGVDIENAVKSRDLGLHTAAGTTSHPGVIGGAITDINSAAENLGKNMALQFTNLVRRYRNLPPIQSVEEFESRKKSGTTYSK